ncbi:glycoside hydrolase [Streptomyces liangshanensis]|uniref:Glycoside hydrolase n=1 Tax=Streptomyces liangshanensis TaxID=2717324 RepID=A0A6G9GXZ1_9ACTN|nr:glycoside hydrolase [Streptomyces liangshanensis]
MASHRKSRGTGGVRSSSPAVGLTTAALASVTLLSAQSADAAPAVSQPSVEDVQKKVDALYRQAGSATRQNAQAKEPAKTAKPPRGARSKEAAETGRETRVAEPAPRPQPRRAAPLQGDAIRPAAATTFATGPQVPRPAPARPAPTQLVPQQPAPQRPVSSPLVPQQLVPQPLVPPQPTRAPRVVPAQGPVPASAPVAAPAAQGAEPQAALRLSKLTVQEKLSTTRALLSRLVQEKTAQAQAQAEARALAEAQAQALAAQAQLDAQALSDAQAQLDAQARAEAEAQAQAAQEQALAAQQAQTPLQPTPAPAVTPAPVPTPTPTPAPAPDSTYATKAAKVLAFARAQIGKPYVSGATGPSSYDSTGLTQTAWRVAGVDLPRTTWEQVSAGTNITTQDLLPGDLVFFYDDISHVGIYTGDGMMIHAPEPGANVREESIYYLPIHGSVRPA